MPVMQMAFPAIKGRQGNHDFYVAMFPLGVIPRLFKFEEGYSHLPAELRAQRMLQARRIPEITKYILDNEDNWVFSSLTASFNAKGRFKPSELDSTIGVLELPLDTEFFINDGQHRRAAIEEALKENKTLEDETISVVLFEREGLERDQQIFSDLNRTVQKTSRSLDILYDRRGALSSLTVKVGEQVPVFRGKVEMDLVSLSARSAHLVTLSSLYDANGQLLGKVPDDIDPEDLSCKTQIAIEFWNEVTRNIRGWAEVANNEMKPSELRADTVSTSSVVLWSIASAGRDVMDEYSSGWQLQLRRLRDIDWRKTNPEWQGVCMLGSDIVTRRQTKQATTDFLRQKLSLTTRG